MLRNAELHPVGCPSDLILAFFSLGGIAELTRLMFDLGVSIKVIANEWSP